MEMRLWYSSQEKYQISTKQEKYFINIYDEVTEDIYDMSNVRIFKVIEKNLRKMGDVHTMYTWTLLCLRSAELSKAFGLRNLYMLLDETYTY